MQDIQGPGDAAGASPRPTVGMTEQAAEAKPGTQQVQTGEQALRSVIDEVLSQNAQDPLGTAIDAFKASGTVTNKQAVDILNNSKALQTLREQTGLELPDTASGRRNAIKAAVEKLAQQQGEIENKSVETDGFTGASGLTYNAEQADLLASLSTEALQNAAGLYGKQDITFYHIGLPSDAETKQRWLDSGLAYEETASDGNTYVAIQPEMLMDERARRRKAQRQTTVNTEMHGASVESRRLTENDIADYMSVGDRKHVRDTKQRLVDNGESPVLTKPEEIVDFIRNAFRRKIQKVIKGYGRVNNRLADAVKSATGGDVVIDDYYLELDADRLAHLSDHVGQDKDIRNIPLSETQVEQLPKYIDTYDDLIEVIRRKDGSVRLKLGKKINGHSIIVEAVSKGRKSLQPVTAFQIDSADYVRKYKTRAIDRSSTSRPANADTVDISRPAIALNTSILRSGAGVNSDSNKSSGTETDALALAEELIALGQGKNAQQQAVDTETRVGYDNVNDAPVYEPHQPGQDIQEFDHTLWEERKAEAAQKYGLSDVESEGVDSYVGGAAYDWNAVLRADANYEYTEFYNYWIQQATAALKKFPQFEGRTYRNLTFDSQDILNKFLAKHEGGKTVTADSFLSSSKDPNGYVVSGDYVVHMVIDGISGRDISETYSIPGQQEVVYLPGTELYITAVDIANDGNPLIYVQEVRTNGKNMETNTDGNGQSSSGANYEGQAGNAERKGHDLGGIHSDRGVEGNGGAGDARQVQQPGSSSGYGKVEGNTESVGAAPAGYAENTVGAAQPQFEHTQKTSAIYSNTYENATDEAVREVGQESKAADPNIDKYDVVTEKESLHNAELRTQNAAGIEAEYEVLISKSGWTGEDNDTAQRVLDHLRKNGDTERFTALARKRREEGTRGAQLK